MICRKQRPLACYLRAKIVTFCNCAYLFSKNRTRRVQQVCAAAPSAVGFTKKVPVNASTPFVHKLGGRLLPQCPAAILFRPFLFRPPPAIPSNMPLVEAAARCVKNSTPHVCFFTLRPNAPNQPDNEKTPACHRTLVQPNATKLSESNYLPELHSHKCHIEKPHRRTHCSRRQVQPPFSAQEMPKTKKIDCLPTTNLLLTLNLIP